MHCKWRCIAFAPFRVYRTSLFQNRAPCADHTAAYPLPSPLLPSCFAATKISQKKPPVQKVQTVAEPHSPSLYGESISALSTTPLGCTTVSATLGVASPPGQKNYNINKGGCQCPFGHSYNFAAFCTNSKNSALNWSLATQLSVCKREMTLPKLACPLYSD